MAARRLCLVVVSRGLFSVCSARASIAVASLVAKAWAPGTRASVAVAHGLSCSAACGIFPDQGSKLCPLNWQEDFYPLLHQESPRICLLCGVFTYG